MVSTAGPSLSGREGNVNVKIQDMVVPNRLDENRTEIFANGLLLFSGAWNAVDTTFVSVRRRPPTFCPLCETQTPLRGGMF